jgi:hypothetical protein
MTYVSEFLTRAVLPPVDLTHGGRYGDGSGYAFPDHRDIASVLGLVKHKPLTRRPSALLDRALRALARHCAGRDGGIGRIPIEPQDR